MTAEKPFSPLNGWLALVLNIAAYVAIVWFFWQAIDTLASTAGLLDSSGETAREGGWMLAGAIFALLLNIFLSCGFFVVAPNDSKVLVLFGVYKGSVRENGFWWANPLMSKTRVTVRARNLEGETLKVNDKLGNPIEISCVVVWQVENTAQALFDVDDYVGYVTAQSEAAVRGLAGTYPYDNHGDLDGREDHGTEVISLREGREQVNQVLEEQLTERLGRAGVKVIESRLTHLAYAPEIAGAMLQRQQATAVVAARTQIVNGAVGMVRMALDKLDDDGVIELDEERKATMVSNLLVVLCGDRSPQPVLNTGTLYS